MRKTIEYDKTYLKEIGYRGAPITQILGLKLKPLEQLILINMFGHKDTYQISINSIANCFGTKKNRSDVADAVKKLVTLGFLQETDTTYIVSLLNIYKDYKKAKADSTANNSGDTKTDINPVSSEDSKTDNSAIIDRNATIDSSANLPDSNAINQVIVQLTEPDSSANNQVIGLLTKSDSSAISNNIKIKEEIKSPQNKLLNNQEDKPEKFSSGLGSDSFNANSISTYSTNKLTSYIKNDQLLKSIYFGSPMNEKVLEVYLKQSNDLKSKLTYQQFENLYVYTLQDILKQVTPNININRDFLIKYLNKSFEYTTPIVLKRINDDKIKDFKEKEKNYMKVLENFKL
jgi:hypothetical protein